MNYLDKGAAFPVMPPLEGPYGHGYPYPEAGISAREYFCIKALAGALASGRTHLDNSKIKRDVDFGMAIADEILRRRLE